MNCRIALLLAPTLLAMLAAACGGGERADDAASTASTASSGAHAGGASTGAGGASSGTAAQGSGGAGAAGASGSGGATGCVDAEPEGLYGIADHDVTGLPAGIGFDVEDYASLLHVSEPGTWEHVPGAAFDGRAAVRFHPSGIVEGYSAVRELHFEQIAAIQQLNVRWLVRYSPDAHTSIASKHTIISRQNDPIGFGSGRAMTIWRPDPVHDGMVLAPCDGIQCSYLGADPPWWPDGSDTFWIGPSASGGYADTWVSLEHEFVTDAPRALGGSSPASCTTIAGTDHVVFEGTTLTQDIEVHDSLLIGDGPDESRYIVQEILGDGEVRVAPVPVGAGGTVSFTGSEAPYEFRYGYSRLYIHTQDGAFAGVYHQTPLWDTGAWGQIAYLDIVGMYGQATGAPWFMLDRLRVDDGYIGPPCGFAPGR